jgi:NDP-sugar pyrophosphorylase family protein
MNDGEPVLAYGSDCYWMDIGRRDDYDRALEEFPEMRLRLLPDEGTT